uniref:Uncharacterized protein n=1 Tax=Brassica campestris TaxID=3711 RepID=M4DZL2_BRACM
MDSEDEALWSSCLSYQPGMRKAEKERSQGRELRGTGEHGGGGRHARFSVLADIFSGVPFRSMEAARGLLWRDGDIYCGRQWRESAFRTEGSLVRSSFPFSRSAPEFSRQRRVVEVDISSITDLPSPEAVRKTEEQCE